MREESRYSFNGIQQELFQKKLINIDEESFKEFLKMLFRACERIYSFKVVERAFNDWQFEREAEREMEEEAEREIEQEDDF